MTDTAKPKNPPAFPLARPDTMTVNVGMTLRDYFAAAALQGLMTDALLRRAISASETAKEAFHYADAMLAERADQ